MDPFQKDRVEKAFETPETPTSDQTYDDGNDGKKKHVPHSTLLIFWIFIGYIVLTFLAAVYFVTTTKTKIFNLSQIASQTSNTPESSLDLPICFPRTNRIALNSSILENKYSGKVASFQTGLSSESATLDSSITLQRGSNLFTYYINNNEIDRVTFYDPRANAIKHRTIEGLKSGDAVIITEQLNLRRPPNESKTKIELEIL